MVGVEHFPGGRQIEVVIGGGAPRQTQHAVEPVADPRVLGALGAGPLHPVDLLVDRGPDAVGQRHLGRLGAVLGRGIVVALAQLLADGGELLAQQILALLLLDALGDLVADLLVDLQLGQGLLGPLEHELDTDADLGGLEDGQLVIGGGVRPRRGGVRERAGVGDGAQDLGQAARPPDVGDLLQHDAQLPAHGLDPGRGARLLDRLGLDPQPGALGDDTGTEAGPLYAAHDGSQATAGQLAGVLDLGDDAHTGGAALDLGHEEHAMVVAGARRGDGAQRLVGVEGNGDDGGGEDHAVRDGDDWKGQGDGVGIGHRGRIRADLHFATDPPPMLSVTHSTVLGGICWPRSRC